MQTPPIGQERATQGGAHVQGELQRVFGMDHRDPFVGHQHGEQQDKDLNQIPPTQTQAITAGMSISAEAVLRPEIAPFCRRCHAVCALMPPKRRSRGGIRRGPGKYLAGEIGPVVVDKNKLRIGALPQQIVGKALLAAGADQQIGIGNAGGIEMIARISSGEMSAAEISPLSIFWAMAEHGAGDFLPAAIVEGDDEFQLGVVAGQALRILEQGHDAGFEAVAAADHSDLDAGPMQLGHVLADEAAQQIEQKRNFGSRAATSFPN